jgi:hypothetical protein
MDGPTSRALCAMVATATSPLHWATRTLITRGARWMRGPLLRDVLQVGTALQALRVPYCAKLRYLQ